MAYPRKTKTARKYLVGQITDISTADEVYFAPGFEGKITAIYSVIDGAIATADATLTAKISGTAVTGGAITVANSGSAAGDVDSALPTGANTFTDTDNIEVETDGASTNTVEATVTVEVEPI